VDFHRSLMWRGASVILTTRSQCRESIESNLSPPSEICKYSDVKIEG